MSLIPKKGTVYVVDDDEAVRDSLQWLLEGKDYRVKCFDSSESFLARFDPREVACLIADIRMEGMSGLELQDRLIERKSPLPIVFITGHGDIPMSVRAMKGGAVDFLTKPFDADQLLDCVAQAVRRDAEQRAEQVEMDAIRQGLDALTPRERQVFERVVTGLLNKEVAHELGVAEKTVKVHRARVMAKMGVQSLAELVHLAEKIGVGLASR